MTGWPFQAPELSPFPPPPSTSPNPRGTGALVRHRRVISDKPAASTPCLLTSSASSPEGSPQPHPGVCPVLPEEATSHTQHNQGGSVVVRTSALWGQPQGKTLSGLPCLFISLAASGNHLSSQEMTPGQPAAGAERAEGPEELCADEWHPEPVFSSVLSSIYRATVRIGMT